MADLAVLRQIGSPPFISGMAYRAKNDSVYVNTLDPYTFGYDVSLARIDRATGLFDIPVPQYNYPFPYYGTGPTVTYFETGDTAVRHGHLLYAEHNDTLYATGGAGALRIFNPETETFDTPLSIGTRLFRMALDTKRKKLYIIDRVGAKIQVVDTTDNSLVTTIDTFPFSYYYYYEPDICDPDGYLYTYTYDYYFSGLFDDFDDITYDSVNDRILVVSEAGYYQPGLIAIDPATDTVVNTTSPYNYYADPEVEPLGISPVGITVATSQNKIYMRDLAGTIEVRDATTFVKLGTITSISTYAYGYYYGDRQLLAEIEYHPTLDRVFVVGNEVASVGTYPSSKTNGSSAFTIDPATDTIEQEITGLAEYVSGVTIDTVNNSIWFGNGDFYAGGVAPAYGEFVVIHEISEIGSVDRTNVQNTTISIDDDPRHIEYVPLNGKVYVTSRGDTSLKVIDPNTRAVTATIDLSYPYGYYPNGIASGTVEGLGDRVWVADEGGFVHVIDAATDTKIAEELLESFYGAYPNPFHKIEFVPGKGSRPDRVWAVARGQYPYYFYSYYGGLWVLDPFKLEDPDTAVVNILLGGDYYFRPDFYAASGRYPSTFDYYTEDTDFRDVVYSPTDDKVYITTTNMVFGIKADDGELTP